MNANPILLEKKYARIVKLFADEKHISLDTALQFSTILKYIPCSEKAYQICTAGAINIWLKNSSTKNKSGSC